VAEPLGSTCPLNVAEELEMLVALPVTTEGVAAEVFGAKPNKTAAIIATEGIFVINFMTSDSISYK
jgi:hypothetical protein